MQGTYKKWKDREVPYHWGASWQKHFPNPDRRVYVAVPNYGTSVLDGYWSAGFSFKKDNFFNCPTTMVEALNHGINAGWLIGERCSLKDD